jgi:predicted PurR-regulated permease PerM
MSSESEKPSDREARDPRWLIVFAVGAALAGVFAAWILYAIRDTIVTVYVSALFAMGISPLVKMIERQRAIPIGKRLPRWLAILVIYATIIAVVISVAMIVIPPLIEQAEELWRSLPERFAQAQSTLVRLGILRRPVTLGEAVQQTPASGGATAVTTIFSTVRNVVGGVFGTITLLLLTFYMLVESREIFTFFVKLFPRHERGRVAAVSATVTEKVSAWLGGQLLLGAIIGLSSALGLGLMGVPYFYVLAVISAIGELIPMLGPILAAIPAILVAATVSPGLAFGVAVFFIIQQQVENTVLVPKIMGRQVGLSAVMVIVALGIGSELMGVLGAILSVPTAAIAQVLFEELRPRDEEKP